MSTTPTASEASFDQYLIDHGYDPGQPEPDLGVETRPDRLIERDGVQVVCEVKEFTTGPLEDGPGVRTLSSSDWYKPIRKAVGRAARQLRPLKHSRFPLVVVISNPHGIWLPLTTEEVIYALYGDPTFTFQIDRATGGAVGGANFGAGRNGRLTNDHPYISAVVIVRERAREYDFVNELSEQLRDGRHEPKTLEEAGERAIELLEAASAADERGEVPPGDYRYVDVIKTMSTTATPLPDNIFDGKRDSRWEFDPDVDGYVRVR